MSFYSSSKMSFVVTSALPVLVRPSKPMPMVTIRPTSIEECQLGLSFTVFFIFEQRCVHEPAETIRLDPSTVSTVVGGFSPLPHR